MISEFAVPLPIYRAAFVRVRPWIGLPDAGFERLRKAYQGADRQGKPGRDIDRAVSQVVGDYLWTFPWFDETAEHVRRLGHQPVMWEQEDLPLGVAWSAVPHNKRVRLLTAVLASAVLTQRAITDRTGMSVLKLTLVNWDERCAASRAVLAERKSAIDPDRPESLPPYFAGDGLALEWQR